MDPTSSRYTSLKGTLLQIKDDLSAVMSILSVEADGGSAFLQTALTDLGRQLIAGQLHQAEEVGDLLGAVLEAKEVAGQGEAQMEAKPFREAVSGLSKAVSCALQSDRDGAFAALDGVAKQTELHPSLLWVASSWRSRVLLFGHDLDAAKAAADKAFEIAQKLDVEILAHSLCELAEIERQLGEFDVALEHLQTAAGHFEGRDDPRGVAKTTMSAARIHRSRNSFAEARQTAEKAQRLDPNWYEPVLFLAVQAVIDRKPARARDIIDTADESIAQHPQCARVLRYLEMLKNEKVKDENLISYLKIRDTPPSPDFVMHLEVICEHEPGFFDAHELLAWTLFRLDNVERAKSCFDALVKQELPGDLKESVLLGIGCVANRTSKNRQPGSWVRQASRAVEDEFGETLSFEADMPPETTLSRLPSGAEPPVSAKKPSPNPVENAAALKGPLQLFAVPDLLDFLKSSRRTGTLVVTCELGMGAVHMEDGMIAGAVSPNSVTIGQLLKENGEVSEEQLAKVAEAKNPRDSHRLFGATLVHAGVVSAESVQKALTTQIKSAVRELVAWQSGQFAFEPEPRSTGPGDEAGIAVHLDTQSLVLDALREIDEQGKEP